MASRSDPHAAEPARPKRRWLRILIAIAAVVVGVPLAAIVVIAIGFPGYQIRTNVTQLVNSAGVCRTSVTEFYQSKGRMPRDAVEAECDNRGWEGSTAPRVQDGTVSVEADGKLKAALVDKGSGTRFVYRPACEGGCVANSPIVRWDCNAAVGTTIEERFLPAACR
jgi:type IV pilus assembly protein PilA